LAFLLGVRTLGSDDAEVPFRMSFSLHLNFDFLFPKRGGKGSIHHKLPNEGQRRVCGHQSKVRGANAKSRKKKKMIAINKSYGRSIL